VGKRTKRAGAAPDEQAVIGSIKRLRLGSLSVDSETFQLFCISTANIESGKSRWPSKDCVNVLNVAIESVIVDFK
jgi:hypothetical protein